MDKKLLTGSRLLATAKSTQSLATTAPLTTSPREGDPNFQKQGNPQKQPNLHIPEGKRAPPDSDLCYEEMLLKEDIKPIEARKLEAVFRRLENATHKLGKDKDHLASTTRENKQDDDTKSEMSKMNGDKKGADAKKHNAKLKEDEYRPHFTSEDVEVILRELNYQATKEEVDNMIWECDEDLDGRINEHEYYLMYKRCIRKDSHLEPKSLFHLIRFLMFIHAADNNKDMKKTEVITDDSRKRKITITEEDTLELIFVREMDIKKMEEVLKTIFGEEEKRTDGQEKEISFAEYLETRRRLALYVRSEDKKKKQEAKSTLKKEHK